MKPKTAYDTARDDYGKLPGDLRVKVLDRVSELTSATSGAEAEAAFVKALLLVQDQIRGEQQAAPGWWPGPYGP